MSPNKFVNIGIYSYFDSERFIILPVNKSYVLEWVLVLV